MKNKNLGIGLLISIGLSFLAAIYETSASDFSDTTYLISGVGMLVFGIWGSIRLIKSNK